MKATQIQIIKNDLERIERRYNPENDAHNVTWVDADMVAIVRRLLEIIDDLQDQIRSAK
jgi:hypothetical protein